MKPLFAQGLVVGKFAPLHRGHELLVQRASALCEKVAVLSWSRPELPECGPERRARWLAERFPEAQRLVVTPELLTARLPGVELPHNEAEAQSQRRFTALLCRELLGLRRVDAVFTSEDYGDALAAELTDFFQAEPPVVHVLVDRERRTVPISGTALRLDLHGQRHWLAPAVYASLVRRICFLGGESTGKSTLSAALAARFATGSVAEYGRELWEAQASRLEPGDMLHIATTQLRREDEAALAARQYLFCDTSPLTTLFYARELFGSAETALEQLAETRYDLAVLCAPDFPFVQDGTRRDDAFRLRQHRWYLDQLQAGGQPWLLVRGSMEERMEEVAQALQALGTAPTA